MDECKPLPRGPGDGKGVRVEQVGGSWKVTSNLSQGRAAQVEPVKRALTAPETKRLKL